MGRPEISDQGLEIWISGLEISPMVPLTAQTRSLAGIMDQGSYPALTELGAGKCSTCAIGHERTSKAATLAHPGRRHQQLAEGVMQQSRVGVMPLTL